MNEDARKKVIEKLHELRGEVGARLGSDPTQHDPVLAHIEEVRTLVEQDPTSAPHAAGTLERRLLAWEAEHPQLTALASGIARALEDAGL